MSERAKTVFFARWWSRPAAALLLAASCLLLAGASASAASVKKKTGEVIEGEIQGSIPIKWLVDERIAFFSIDGKDVIRIDERGTQCRGESLFLLGRKNATWQDVLQGLVWRRGLRGLNKKGEALYRNISPDRQVVGLRIEKKDVKPAPEKLLGVYRIDDAKGSVDVLTRLEIRKADGGLVTVGIDEVVEANAKDSKERPNAE